MQKGDFVKINNVGIGKIESIYDNKDLIINILGTKYYRDLKLDKDIQKSNITEYIQYLKTMLKELTQISKAKRKEAAEYNKSVDGLATKRKGKVTVVNGNIFGLCENSISNYHRNLLNEAKKIRQLKDKIKKELKFYEEIYK